MNAPARRGRAPIAPSRDPSPEPPSPDAAVATLQLVHNTVKARDTATITISLADFLAWCAREAGHATVEAWVCDEWVDGGLAELKTYEFAFNSIARDAATILYTVSSRTLARLRRDARALAVVRAPNPR